jgi:drug/metabolite transporter (DMT)-like permease
MSKTLSQTQPTTLAKSGEKYVRGTTMMLIATVCFASGSFFAKAILNQGVDPLTLMALRMPIAALLLWAFYSLLKSWRPFRKLASRRQFWGCVAVAVANSLSQSFYFTALVDTDPGLASMIFSTNPVITALILLFFGERLTKVTILRMVLAMTGLYFLTLAGGLPGRPLNPVSVILIIGCAITYAIHLVLYQKLLGSFDSRTNTVYILTIMAAIFLVIELFRHNVSSMTNVSLTAWLLVIGMAIIATAIARVLMFSAIGLIGGTQIALIGLAEPVLVLIGSVIIIGERLSLSQWLGAGLVLSSITLSAFRQKQPNSGTRGNDEELAR